MTTTEAELSEWANAAVDTFLWKSRPGLYRMFRRDGLSTRYFEGRGYLSNEPVFVEVCVWVSDIVPHPDVRGKALVDIRRGYDRQSSRFVHRVEINQNGCVVEPHPGLAFAAFNMLRNEHSLGRKQ